MFEPQLNEKLWPPDIRRTYWQYLKAEKTHPKQKKYYVIRIRQFIEKSEFNDFYDIPKIEIGPVFAISDSTEKTIGLAT